MENESEVAVITGGASGLGAATAGRLAAAGYRVVTCDVASPPAGLSSRLAQHVICDVTDDCGLEAAFSNARSFGRIGVVVSCAGRLHSELMYDAEARSSHAPQAFSDLVRTNLCGTFNVLRHAARSMCDHPLRADGERGVIVMTGSIAGDDGQIGQVAYAASKAAIAGMTLPAARELARYGIRVVTVAPGVFETAMMRAIPDQVVRGLERQFVHPARMGRGDEFASLVEEIIRNRYLNGATVRLDAATRLGCG